MKELPVPFTGAMVRAIFDRRKTQTRRLRMLCRPGDRLWVREAWRAPREFDGMPPRDIPVGTPIYYEANGAPTRGTSWGKLRPPMFMCRWMCRLVLDVTEVRGHQLLKITEEEAWAEGCQRGLPDDIGGFFPAEEPDPSGIGSRGWDSATDWFADLWDSINGAKAPWDSNPYVWAHSFKVAP